MGFMKFKNLLWLAQLMICFMAAGSAAQITPPSLEGKVEVIKRGPRSITRSPRGSTSVSRITNSVLFVLSDPEDARIIINNKPVGRAVNGEFRTELPAGRQYAVQVEGGEDYGTYKQTVRLTKNRYGVVKAALPPRYGMVQIGPAIEGAKLFINGRAADSRAAIDKDSNTLKIDKLEPGEHKITYQHPDYVPLENRFNVVAGSQYIWTYDPERATVELTVVTDAGASVYINGAFVGTTPGDGTLKSDVRLGEREIKLVKDDYEEFKRTARFEFRKPVKIEQRLTPLPTSVRFEEFFETPIVERWTLPPQGWAVRGGRLHIENTSAIAYPTNVRYRGFTMDFI